MKSLLWRVAKCLSYIEEARCLKVNKRLMLHLVGCLYYCISDAGRTDVKSVKKKKKPPSLRMYVDAA